MINVKDTSSIQKIKSLFPEEKKQIEKEVSYDFFYAIKASVIKSQIDTWDKANELFGTEEPGKDYIISAIDEELSKYNSRNYLERKLELVTLSENETAMIFLLSCDREQTKLEVVNKFGVLARALWSSKEFSKLVIPNTSKQNRLFRLGVKQVDKDLNVIKVISE
jgi:hypothetical protein